MTNCRTIVILAAAPTDAAVPNYGLKTRDYTKFPAYLREYQDSDVFDACSVLLQEYPVSRQTPTVTQTATITTTRITYITEFSTLQPTWQGFQPTTVRPTSYPTTLYRRDSTAALKSGCMTNGDCADGEICNDWNTCVRRRYGCMTDADCAYNEFCNERKNCGVIPLCKTS